MAATVEPSDFKQLIEAARLTGATPVVVNLELVPLDAIQSQGKALQTRLEQRTRQLTAELGSQAWSAGSWGNGAGQLEIYLTERGIQLLKGSANAVSFRPGRPWVERTALGNADGRFAAVEAALARDGQVDVEVLPNTDGLEFDLAPNGKAMLRPSSVAAASAKAAEVLADLGDKHVLNRSSAASQLAKSASPAPSSEFSMVLRLTREGVVKLASNPLTRSMRPVDHTDSRPMRVDSAATAAAQRDGSANVVVTLRNPILGGQLSRASHAAQTQTHRDSLRQVLAASKIDHSKWSDISVLGAMSGRVTAAQLAALVAANDGRVLSIDSNNVVAQPALWTSGNTMNMKAGAWDHGYRGAGQGIIVVDSGVQASHTFFRNASGVSRVVFEACFASDQTEDLVDYESTCPNKDANGDSPVGLSGSAAPLATCASAANASNCSHGTHVAGIAAGRNVLYAGINVQGMAPDANIIAVRVASYDKKRVAPPKVFRADALLAMQTVVNAMNSQSSVNPFTVNLSLASNSNIFGCDQEVQAFTTAVATLRTLGVPTVVATGNNALNGSISWPACITGTIKASSVKNDGIGNERSPTANLANPLVNVPFWLAPGGSEDFPVRSSLITPVGATANFGNNFGTSMAAPHISGIYAVAKAALGSSGTVDGVTEWLTTNARVAVPLCLFPPCGTTGLTVYSRIRLP